MDISPLAFQWKTMDPFLFCVHHLDHYPAGNAEFGPDASLVGRQIGYDFTLKDGWRMYHGRKVPGFPVHPHRGFETVTIVRKGFVDHSDSLGSIGRYGQGDVQWMTAGKGIQHCEMFPLLNRDKPNTLELFQIWLNLPRKSKFVEPEYVMLWAEQIPHIQAGTAQNGNVMIADYTNPRLNTPRNSWAADPANEVLIQTLRLEAGSSYLLPGASAGLNRMLYFFEGEGLLIDDYQMARYSSAVLRSEKDVSLKASRGAVQGLILQGRPIGETVFQYGPFVMGSRQEIDDAYNDYQETRFGGWPYHSPEPVHGSGMGRFARFADGRLETPNEG